WYVIGNAATGLVGGALGLAVLPREDPGVDEHVEREVNRVGARGRSGLGERPALQWVELGGRHVRQRDLVRPVRPEVGATEHAARTLYDTLGCAGVARFDFFVT
ncbi:hypothetical protein IAE22_33585, partial [Bacillus sp. S34]|nr:hypothetical protein [Bacillus sp. S34]